MDFPAMVKVIPEARLGVAAVEHFAVSEDESRFTALRPGDYVPPGKYARLKVNGCLVMSDTHMEHRTNYGVVNNAHGRVLIAGLGLGMIVHPITARREVESITIVEISSDVKALISPTLPKTKPIEVIVGDIYAWLPATKTERFNTIYFDIWSEQSTDCLQDMTILHRRFRRYLDKSDPKAWMDSWNREDLRYRRRQERTQGW